MLYVLNKPDQCVYNFYAGGVILCLYVDEILLLGTNINVVKEVKHDFSQNFEMKYVGVVCVRLNIEQLRECDGRFTPLQFIWKRS
jgi:hypothetical protein